jgi:hypothetical protein
LASSSSRWAASSSRTAGSGSAVRSGMFDARLGFCAHTAIPARRMVGAGSARRSEGSTGARLAVEASAKAAEITRFGWSDRPTRCCAAVLSARSWRGGWFDSVVLQLFGRDYRVEKWVKSD